MALIQYNGITLPYADLTEFRMEAVYDPSGTDRILTKYIISAQTVVNPDFLPLMDPTLELTTVSSPVTAVKLVQQKLMQQRQQLSVKFNGVEMIPERQQGVSGYVDAANGPKPSKVEFIPVDGATNTTFILLFSIEANYWVRQYANTDDLIANPNKNLPGNVVLYNRWTESVQIDEENRTVKKRTGKFLIRSDNSKGFIPDQVRTGMAVVGLPPGRFVRHRSEYTVTEDGLGLAYDITDREVFRLPPPPAFKADAEYAEQGTRGDGKRILSFRIKLWGDNDTDQVALIKTCAAIAFFKVQSRGANLYGRRGESGIILGSTLRVGGYENWAEFRLIALKAAIPNTTTAAGGFSTTTAGRIAAGAFEFFRRIGAAAGVGGGGGGGGNIGAGAGAGAIGGAIGGADAADATAGVMAPSQNAAFLPDPGIQPNYLIRGTAGLLLQAARYYDPSLQNVQLGQGSELGGNGPVGFFNGVVQLSAGVMPGEAGKTPE